MVIQKWWPGPQPKAAGGEQLGDWLFREKGELARFTQRRQRSQGWRLGGQQTWEAKGRYRGRRPFV